MQYICLIDKETYSGPSCGVAGVELLRRQLRGRCAHGEGRRQELLVLELLAQGAGERHAWNFLGGCYGILLPTAKILAIWVLGPNPQGTPGNDQVPAESLPLCFRQGHKPQKQHPKASFLQRIASQTQGHSAICSCKKPFPNYQAEPSIAQTRHRHTSQEHPKQQSCPLPTQKNVSTVPTHHRHTAKFTCVAAHRCKETSRLHGLTIGTPARQRPSKTRFPKGYQRKQQTATTSTGGCM